MQLRHAEDKIRVVLTLIYLQIPQDLVDALHDILGAGDILVGVGDEGGDDAGPHNAMTLATGDTREGQQLGDTGQDTDTAQVRVGEDIGQGLGDNVPVNRSRDFNQAQV